LQKTPADSADFEVDQNRLDKVSEPPATVNPELSIARSLEQQIPDLFASEDLEVASDRGTGERTPSPKLEEIVEIEGEEHDTGILEKSETDDESLIETQALTKTDGANLTDWSSAASARASLERLSSGQQTRTVLQFWNRHRGDIYLAIAVVLVLCVILWAMGSGSRVKATPTAPSASGARTKPARDVGLSFFDRVLIELGVADAPDTPPDRGSPGVQVWVDLRTALYYCPGADLYGKTPKGKFTTQREAQLDQFEPAYRKACD
jgi:hypothetical protein